ncbi:hypothetical protein [Streptomyces hainanensis]|uniref:Uncharacterized protein n=1 Tax=Streptomyces hainanensis TaxID=402648 RepID=A0A4R4T4J2_9ACTN|nr:hypothetical protein [Streptomyces hainanensis]TDC69279.1 hypothetical protein E1283_26155 [Streptomyces hainanensis]
MAIGSPQDDKEPVRPEWFDREVESLVKDTAPRLCALVEEFATESGHLDAGVAAWCLAHPDGPTQVVRDRWFTVTELGSPEEAAQLISRRSRNTVRVIWA